MKKVLVAGALLASACSGRGEIIPNPSPAPDSPATTGGINPDVQEAAPTTTEAPTTTTTVEVVAVTTTLPILCPHLPHPAHHRECPPPTTAVPRQQTSTEPTGSTALPYNGWAIPEYIVSCETGGTFDWYAHNASGASGPYQLMPIHFGGELAMHQSRAAQHAKAAQLWDGGRGKNHWRECL